MSRRSHDFLDAKNLTVVSHPLYAPGWTPYDFFLVPRMKLQNYRYEGMFSGMVTDQLSSFCRETDENCCYGLLHSV